MSVFTKKIISEVVHYKQVDLSEKVAVTVVGT